MDAIKALAKATVSKDAVIKDEDKDGTSKDNKSTSHKSLSDQSTADKSKSKQPSSKSSTSFKPAFELPAMPPRLNIGPPKHPKVESVKSHHFDWDLEDTDEAIRIDFSKISKGSRKRKTSSAKTSISESAPDAPSKTEDKNTDTKPETSNISS